jgi:Icc-related predicted phosphoesterase
VKLVCVSDTHTYQKEVTLPDGDVLVHAGDLTFRGTYGETRAALEWLESAPFERKILVAGNHDFYFDERFKDGHVFRNWAIQRKRSVADLMTEFPSVTYLQDAAIEIDGVKFYGSPWQPWFHEWAFNFPLLRDGDFKSYGNYIDPAHHDRAAAAATWAKIPDDVNVLVTHSPPEGILDRCIGMGGDNRAGCPELRKRLDSGLLYLRAHIFGHIHEAYGQEERSGIQFVNAAINTRDYDPINAPIVVEIAS